jgi:hypothetical protein
VINGRSDGFAGDVSQFGHENIALDLLVGRHIRDIPYKKVRGQLDRNVVAIGAQLVQVPVTTDQFL